MSDVDFANSTFSFLTRRSNVVFRAPLAKGLFQKRIDAEWDSVKLDAVHELPSSPVGAQYALALFTWFTAAGSSGTEGIGQVLELRGGRLTVIQQLEWDEHVDTKMPYQSFDSASNTLVVRTAHYLPGDSHCCISAVDVVSFRWTGRGFLQESVRTELSDYGVRAGEKI